jgi:SOS-response transcriptional repressor LexA
MSTTTIWSCSHRRHTNSTYRAHEGGTRTIGQDDAERYARRFRAAGANITAPIILFGTLPATQTEPADQSKLIQVPLLSWVSAGELVDADSQVQIADVPLLAFADLGPGEYFALRVDGDSMDRLSPDGSVIVVNRVDRDLVPDRCYVFSRRGEATYKVWQPDPPHLAPYSTNPAHKPVFVKGKKDFEIVGRVRRTVLDL